MASVVDLMAAPGCRRRRLLAHFAEARGACDAASELLCDFCADPQVSGRAGKRWGAQRKELMLTRSRARPHLCHCSATWHNTMLAANGNRFVTNFWP
jgi:hypothetical protein